MIRGATMIAIAAAVVLVPGRAVADGNLDHEFAGDVGVFHRELELTDDQKQKLSAVVVDARKQTLRAEAELDIAGIDLSQELSRPRPDKKRVRQLIVRVSELEGRLRAIKVIAWLSARELLTTRQARTLAKLGAGRPKPGAGTRASDTARDTGYGTLSIGARPAARVFVDGRSTGRMTPVAGLQLRAGRHRVTLVFEDQKQTRTVDIRAGKQTRMVVDLRR